MTVATTTAVAAVVAPAAIAVSATAATAASTAAAIATAAAAAATARVAVLGNGRHLDELCARTFVKSRSERHRRKNRRGEESRDGRQRETPLACAHRYVSGRGSTAGRRPAPGVKLYASGLRCGRSHRGCRRSYDRLQPPRSSCAAGLRRRACAHDDRHPSYCPRRTRARAQDDCPPSHHHD